MAYVCDFGSSFDEYLEVVKNKHYSICSECGSDHTTNYDSFGKAFCYDCYHSEWDKKFKYKVVGVHT